METQVETPQEPRVIVPTIGRQVWYWRRRRNVRELEDDSLQPEAATVCYVWDERMVNLRVINKDGHSRAETSTVLRQPDDEPPAHDYCEWMPFQVGQAKAQRPTIEKLEAILKQEGTTPVEILPNGTISGDSPG